MASGVQGVQDVLKRGCMIQPAFKNDMNKFADQGSKRIVPFYWVGKKFHLFFFP